ECPISVSVKRLLDSCPVYLLLAFLRRFDGCFLLAKLTALTPPCPAFCVTLFPFPRNPPLERLVLRKHRHHTASAAMSQMRRRWSFSQCEILLLLYPLLGIRCGGCVLGPRPMRNFSNARRPASHLGVYFSCSISMSVRASIRSAGRWRSLILETNSQPCVA